LFGYTGASTMALAVVGYHVAHVDAAKPNVQATRIAAEHNGLAEAPIRYLVDDAMKFAAREVRRNRKYHTIVLDPPAYGHSPDGRAWRLQRDLWPLLENCFRLLDPAEFRLLITGHSPEVDQSNVTAFLEQSAFIHHAEAASGLIIQSGRSQLWDASGRSLDAGFYVRAESSRL
jgi:23S rRNA (cytosine1962-C5)-methyltransferase